MYKDEAIEEIRETRHKISVEYGHNTKKLLDHYKELEKRFKDRLLIKGERVARGGHSQSGGDLC